MKSVKGTVKLDVTTYSELHDIANKIRCKRCWYGGGRHSTSCVSLQKYLSPTHVEAVRRVLRVV
jgi:hypothetical protein